MTKVKRGRGRPTKNQGPAIDLDALLDTATRSFATRGYEASSVRDISRQLGISHSLAHHYYDNKESLWRACIDRGFGRIDAEMGTMFKTALAQPNMESAIRQSIEQYVLLAEQFSDYILILLQEATRGGERFKYIIDTHFSRSHLLALEFYQRTVDAGLLRNFPWQTVFTMVFLGGPARYALSPVTDSDADSDSSSQGKPFDPAQHARDVTDLILNGILPASRKDHGSSA